MVSPLWCATSALISSCAFEITQPAFYAFTPARVTLAPSPHASSSRSSTALLGAVFVDDRSSLLSRCFGGNAAAAAATADATLAAVAAAFFLLAALSWLFLILSLILFAVIEQRSVCSFRRVAAASLASCAKTGEGGDGEGEAGPAQHRARPIKSQLVNGRGYEYARNKIT